jgi:hypothetical protein
MRCACLGGGARRWRKILDGRVCVVGAIRSGVPACRDASRVVLRVGGSTSFAAVHPAQAGTIRLVGDVGRCGMQTIPFGVVVERDGILLLRWVVNA